MIGDYKEVFFDVYCETCKHKSEPPVIYEENSDKVVSTRCNDCLTIPARIDSHKPEYWEDGTK